MTTTAAGDAAVARLNKATEAFEKIITGASNQVVDVPGYGNQPTLAARVDERLDETTATAAAEANRSRDEADRATTQANAAANSVTLATAEFNKAKTQADRAQSEADRAAQITGLETVADAIGMAALPLPDVLAPLSDSLRLITGYGRDVLVGSDVVARMVNFSRNSTATYIGKDGQLKTAAANEPRFEKEGLWLEGQSTNLNPRSQQYNWQDGYGASPGVQSANTDPQSSALIPMIDVSPGRRRPFISGVMTVGKTYTISFRAKSDGGSIGQPTNQLTGAVYPAVSPGEWKTYSFTGVATASSVDFQITGTSVSIAWIQVEELPFASSYIPTNGTAATRTADFCNIPRLLNMGSVLPTDLTIAITFNKTGFDSAYSNYVVHLVDIENAGRYGIATTNAADEIYSFDGYGNAFAGDVIKTHNNPLVLCLGGNGARGYGINGKYTQVSAGNLTRRTIPNGSISFCFRTIGTQAWGHIRDFRLWRRELTAEQCRAIA